MLLDFLRVVADPGRLPSDYLLRIIVSCHELEANEHMSAARDKEREHEEEELRNKVVQTANVGCPLQYAVVSAIDFDHR